MNRIDLQKIIFCALILLQGTLFSQTIEEKLASFGESFSGQNEEMEVLSDVNTALAKVRSELSLKYLEVDTLIAQKADEEEFAELLEEINHLREEIHEIESNWRDSQVRDIGRDNEKYGVWEGDDVTLSQLVMEHGSQDYLYVIPQELVTMKLHMHSSLMIPRESWPSLLEGILKYNGVGVREVNAYTKQLFSLKQDFTAISAITTELYQLEALDPKARIAHIYSPKIENLRAAFYFIERFRDPKSSFVYQVGTKIAIVGFQEEVKKLISLAENVWQGGEEKITRVVPTTKIPPDEVIKILKNYFNGLSDGRSPMGMKGGNDLSCLPLNGTGVILIGPSQIVDRAEEIIKSTESQVDDPYELTVFWYSCSHTNPTDLAEILEEVYASLICSSVEGIEKKSYRSSEGSYDFPYVPQSDVPPQQGMIPDNGSLYPHLDAMKPFGGIPLGAKKEEDAVMKKNTGSFIPYPTAGKLLMVVRKDMIPKIKEVIKRLDVPKRMVEIEVLLCERRIDNATRSGINLLRIGTQASGKKAGGFNYDRTAESPVKGLIEFFLSRKSSSAFPAFDVSYNFLLSQEDIRVTASPSVLAINQTPATIAITDQISINNGASPVETNSGFVFKDSYDRADFGITITLVPTIHEPEIDDPHGEIYVTLENDIVFEDIKGEIRSQDRPDVHKRAIKNQVRIADGQTVILGGLKTKAAEDKNEKIPFLGELPGIGKLFGTTVLNDRTNEMFIFIRPKVIHDPKQDLLRIREERLRKRPGDIELILTKIKEAREKCEVRRFQASWDLLFKKPEDETCVP